MTDKPEKKRSTQTVFQRDAALVQLAPDAKVISRENVEQVARLVGEGSAAADALKRADEHDGPVRFWYSQKLGTLSLELLKETLH